MFCSWGYITWNCTKEGHSQQSRFTHIQLWPRFRRSCSWTTRINLIITLLSRLPPQGLKKVEESKRRNLIMPFLCPIYTRVMALEETSSRFLITFEWRLQQEPCELTSRYIHQNGMFSSLWCRCWLIHVPSFRYGLLGPSGCGKTTLLRCIIGRLTWESGDILTLGKKPGTVGHSVPGVSIGYMPQVNRKNYLIDWRTSRLIVNSRWNIAKKNLYASFLNTYSQCFCWHPRIPLFLPLSLYQWCTLSSFIHLCCLSGTCSLPRLHHRRNPQLLWEAA